MSFDLILTVKGYKPKQELIIINYEELRGEKIWHRRLSHLLIQPRHVLP
jgi:hypothetical protein